MGLDWLKYNIFLCEIPWWKPFQTMNIHLNNEEQECKTGPVMKWVLVWGKSEWKGKREVKVVNVLYMLVWKKSTETYQNNFK
jgi:hypothetical protein